MKKKMLLAMILMSMIILTGCATIEYNIDLNRDGSGILGFNMLYSNDIISYMGDAIEESKDDLKTKGFEVEDYKTENQTGYKATKKITDMAEWSKAIKSTNNDGSGEKSNLDVKREGNKLYINGVLDFSDNKEGAAFLEGIEFTINVKMPFKAIEHNANKYENGILTWKINFTEKNEINLVADVVDYMMLGIIGLGIIVTIFIAIIVVKGKNKNKNNNEIVEDENAVNIQNEDEINEVMNAEKNVDDSDFIEEDK